MDIRKHIEAQMEAQRHTAQQAARDAATLDERSVLYAVEAKLAAGLESEARAIVQAWRTQKQVAA